MEKRVEVDVNWDFGQVVANIEVLKNTYVGFLSPFFNSAKIREWKEKIYSLKIAEWRCDRLWEYLNGDIEKDVLEKIL